MLAMASARSAPMARPAPGPPAAGASVERCGVGVAGTAAAPELAAAAARTGGAAGVAAVEGWAGVAGGAAAAGFSLGCRVLSALSVPSMLWSLPRGAVLVLELGRTHLVHHAHDVALLLNVVGADRLVILEDFACAQRQSSLHPRIVSFCRRFFCCLFSAGWWGACSFRFLPSVFPVQRTRVNELLVLRVPALFGRDLLLEGGDLGCVSVGARAWRKAGEGKPQKERAMLTRSLGSASSVNFCCLRSCVARVSTPSAEEEGHHHGQHRHSRLGWARAGEGQLGRAMLEQGRTLKVIFMVGSCVGKKEMQSLW